MSRARGAGVVGALLVLAACTPSEGPKSIPLPTSPDTTTTTTSTTTTSTTTTTTTTNAPPRLQATIRRTADGVPHISGRTLADVAFGQGYVSADDHGCTLIDQVLRVTGQRSRTQGPGPDGENIESDFAWQAIGLADRAAADFANASDRVVEQFEAFTDGWNQALADSGDEGFEDWCGDADWVRPVSAVEAYTYARSISLLASGERLADFIPSAQPPIDPEAQAEADASTTADSEVDVLEGDDPATPDATDARRANAGFAGLRPAGLGSNAWAIGAEQVEGGTGAILLGNPHFPWEGPLRFAEVHLTTDDGVDAYGAQLVGLPGLAVGFTDTFAWSHTVSAGNRFTAYTLTLDPESPTSYLVDGESQPMVATGYSVEILRPDGSIDTETRTLYSTEYGPVIDFPGIGWSESTVLSYRDANIDNDEMIEFYADIVDDADLDEFIASHELHQGVPLFNTVAVGADGRAWYADTSATPNLSPEAEEAYNLKLLAGDLLTTIARDNGVVLLDGSDSVNRWQISLGARDDGLVPFSLQPQTLRTDHVFNANDSYWVSNATQPLEGEFSVLHGRRDVPQSLRTRQNATVLDPANPLGLAGDDGLWNATEVVDAAFDNMSHSALLLRPQVVAACRANPLIEVTEIIDEADGTVALPAETVDLTAACDVLDAWDGRYDLDRSGPVLWREMMGRFSGPERRTTGPLLGDEFDPANPVGTPAQLADDVAPALTALARAVQTLTKVGFALDATLGAAQFTERAGERIAVHGGTNADGVTNVIQWGGGNSSSAPQPERGGPVVPGGTIRPEGFQTNFGTSFVFMVDYTGGEPVGQAILTYGQVDDIESPDYLSQTIRFAEKNWRPLLLDPEAITADDQSSEQVVSLP